MFVPTHQNYDAMTSQELLELLALGLLIVRVCSESAVSLLTLLPVRRSVLFAYQCTTDICLRGIASHWQQSGYGERLSPRHCSIVLAQNIIQSYVAPKYIRVGIFVKVGGNLEV